MADFDSELDVVGALEKYLNIPDEAEAAPETTVEQPKPEPTQEIQPQAAPEAEQQESGASAAEVAEAPAVETQATPQPETPKPQPDRSQELEQRLGKAIQTEQEAAAARDQLLSRLNTIVPQLEAGIRAEFADLKSPEDVYRLMQTDPNRYNQFVIAQTRLNQASQIQQAQQAEAQKAFIAGEQKRLQEAIPDLADPDKAEALKVKLRAYAKSQGIPDNRQARNADEVIRLHREMVLADEVATLKAEKKARDEAIAKANEKAAKAPPVQKPGTQREVNKDEKAEADFERFTKSGRTDDLATALQNLM